LVLFVSTIEPRKNVPTLVQAIGQLRECYKEDVRLVLAGGKRLALEDAFRTIGRAPPGQRGSLSGAGVRARSCSTVQRCRAVGPSCFFYEGLPSAVGGNGLWPTGESFPNVASLPEVVGDAGLLIDPHDVDELVVATVAHFDRLGAAPGDAPQGPEAGAALLLGTGGPQRPQRYIDWCTKSNLKP